MKKLYFDDDKSFLEWNEKAHNFITAVFDGGEFLCDVLQKDVFYLKDIGFLGEGAEVIPSLTIEQQEMFKDNWGVEIIIREDLYDLVCKLLTWYEHRDECPYDDDELFEEMYDALARVQNELFNQ